jgi:potassium channel subfamily K
MARRLSFSVAQPLSIAGWYIASILLIALVIVTSQGLQLAPGQNRALTQAFYYAIIAAGLYFIIATLMVSTVYGAFRGYYPREFELTTSQRTLMLQTIAFMVYVLGGAAVYAKVEKWKFLDAVYFAEFTLLTIGIGDITPLTHLGRSLLFPYAVGGILILSLVIGSIRSLVLDRGKDKLSSRILEKTREGFLKQMEKSEDITILNPVSNEKEAQKAGMSEYDRRKKEFELMRKIQHQASVRQQWTALVSSGMAAFLLWFIGAVVFHKAEGKQGWTYFQSLYFAYTSLLTIGYGDFSPVSNSGKPFFVFWSLLAVPTLTILLSNIGNTVLKWVRDLTIYLGELTVLPGEANAKDLIKQTAAKIPIGKSTSSPAKGGDRTAPPPGLFGEKKGDHPGETPNQILQGRAADRLAGELEQDEANLTQNLDSEDLKNLHDNPSLYHFLLIKEIRSVLKHTNETPPRKYTYDDWVWFLKLMGEDESTGTSHRKPRAKVQPNTEAQDGNANVNGGSDREGKKASPPAELQQGQTDDRDGDMLPWSWLGVRSPLMGEAEESEWVLERLSKRLERELGEGVKLGRGKEGRKGGGLS